jgi:hypothetical protein
MNNALDPNLMTAAERLAEIGEILAAGLIRLRAKRLQTVDRRAFPSTSPPPGAVMAETNEEEKGHE